MPLTPQEDQDLKEELLALCDRIKSATKTYDPKRLRKLLRENGAYNTLNAISSAETSGLATLFLLGKQHLSVEQYVLDHEIWSKKLDAKIIKQCKTNLGKLESNN